MNLNRLRTFVALLILAQGFAAKSQITFAWNPSVSAAPITNYTVYWGASSGFYVYEADAGTQTNLTVTGLAPNTVYYFAVTATDQNGMESPNSSEVVCTNDPLIMPPIPSGGNIAAGTNGGGTTNSTGSSGGGSGGSSASSSASSVPGEVSIPGIPPVLSLSFDTNHKPLLTITGTVGSTLLIQSTTNVANLNTWNTITNLGMSNAWVGAITNPGAANAITLAFVPAISSYEVIDTNAPSCEFYQAVMPYDYMVLADSVLSGQGYPSRLVLVRMPGIQADDVCFVTAKNSFLFYDTTNRAFAVEPSGSTIRQIATTLSSWLGQNWTSASEFSYSNGVSSILATVVETEPSSSDPVAGASAPDIQIDF